MLQILSFKGSINFLRHALPISIMSAVLVVASLASLATKGINWGLDFTGGTSVIMEFSKPANLDELRLALDTELTSGAVYRTSVPAAMW